MSPFSAAVLCLALNGYHEARGEPFEGQIAVAQVVLRRANYDDKRVCREVYRPAQFSWTKEPPPVQKRSVAWQDAVQAAKIALLWAKGANLPDYSGGATHYYAAYIRPPKWTRGMTFIKIIGLHLFYRRKSK